MEPELLERWIVLRENLCREGFCNLAVIFIGYAPTTFKKEQGILYVGKATAGPFMGRSASSKNYGCHGSAFWTFARRLDVLCGGRGLKRPDNIAWSNLLRIGKTKGNPSEKLTLAQVELAAETLKNEIDTLRPRLIVCVSENYQEQIVYAALGLVQDRGDDFQTCERGNHIFWYRTSSDGIPPFLWMKHPERKRKSYLDAAFEVAEDLWHENG